MYVILVCWSGFGDVVVVGVARKYLPCVLLLWCSSPSCIRFGFGLVSVAWLVVLLGVGSGCIGVYGVSSQGGG